MTNNTHKITNKETGATLEGALVETLIETPTRHFAFQIAGTTGANDLKSAEWDIEEIKPPAPTEPGFYVDTSGRPTLARVYRLGGGGLWTGYFERRLASIDLADLPANLVRLVPEITEVTDEMVIAFEDNSRGDGPLRESRRAGLLAAIKVAQNG